MSIGNIAIISEVILINFESRAKSTETFSNEIKSTNSLSLCSNELSCDPNLNYNTINKVLSDAIDKHMPLHTAKFNKYKHKRSEWMTNGLLISIKYRDKLYKNLKTSSLETEYDRRSINLKTYDNILKKNNQRSQIQILQ